ncbi:MAG: ABC transporter ATP-binding protein [Alphaproteobacteria bacterium]|nr:ABC transporter ATP-binding protein [Alphaproteobacteria bacterium]
MNSAEVRLLNLSKHYQRTRAVDDVSLTIEPGSMVALLGPSGCGKTTALRMIAGLVAPTSGEILVNGERITSVPVHKRNIGMLFQNYALFPHMTVAENIAFGLDMRGISKADTVARVRHALDLVRLGDFGERFPAQLSGGQQQRVALARALVIEPAVLLLDEPLGALDKGLRESMQVELRALQRRLGVTTVMVTHDQDEALTMADQIVVMRDGRLEQVGSATEIYQRPNSTFVATFLGASNLFTGKVARRDGKQAAVVTSSGIRLLVNDAGTADGDVTVSVRPEAVVVERHGGGAAPDRPNAAMAHVDQVVYRGFISHYYLRLADGQELIAYHQNQTRDDAGALRQGEQVIARWDGSSNHVIPRG